MKKILNTKRKYTYLDLLRLIFLFFGHFALWAVFGSLLYSANYLIQGDGVETIFNHNKVLTFYILIAAPIISYIFNTISRERGSTSAKAVWWSHSMVVIIYSFISFVFF